MGDSMNLNIIGIYYSIRNNYETYFSLIHKYGLKNLQSEILNIEESESENEEDRLEKKYKKGKIDNLYNEMKGTIEKINNVLVEYTEIKYNVEEKTGYKNMLHILKQVEQQLKNLKSSNEKDEKIISELLLSVRILSFLISELIN